MKTNHVVVIGVLAMAAGAAFGQQADYRRYYVGPAQGVWSDPANWATSAGGIGGAGVPVAGEGLPFDGSQSAVVSVGQSTAVTVNADYGAASLVTFDMMAANGATLTVTQAPGTVTARASTLDSAGGGTVAYLNLGGRHIATEPAGSISLAESAGSNVTYLLDNGGTVRAGNLYVGKGGNGTLNQVSGSVGVSTNLYVGYGAGASGSYALGAGGVVAGAEVIGVQGTGLFRQTGGTNSVDDGITVGPQGTYEMSGGTLRADQTSIEVKSGGTFRQSGGTATVGLLTGGGAVVLGGSAHLVIGSGHVGGLAIDGSAVLDIGMGTLAVDSGGTGAIREMLGAGRLVSSMVAADQTGVWGIGYGAAGADGAVVRCTLLGDANLDGEIGADDYAAIDAGSVSGIGGWGQGDFNYDGVVDREDYLLIDRSMMWQDGLLPADVLAEREARFGSGYVAELDAVVPEPGAFGVLVAGAWVVGRRRRR